MTEKELIITIIQAQTVFEAKNKMMSVLECAKFLGCHTDTVRKLIKSNNKNNQIIAFKNPEGTLNIPMYQFYKSIIESWGYYTKPNYPIGLKPYRATKKKKTYLMFENTTGFCKIGVSNNPKQREVTLQSQKPDITLYAVTDKNIEKYLHIKYSSKRVRGEWFNLNKQDVTDILNKHRFKKVN